jgi:hypothetical protein
MWTYHVLIQFPDQVDKIGNIMKIKIYICSVHFLKSFISKVKKIEKNKTVAKSFIFAFSLLQNSVTIKQFDTNLWHIYNLFCNRFMNYSTYNSLIFLKKEISNRKFSHLNIRN